MSSVAVAEMSANETGAKKKVANKKLTFLAADAAATVADVRYVYSGRMRTLIAAYNAVVQLLCPHYPWYVFPGYLQFAVYQHYVRHYKHKFRLLPMPNLLYDQLLKDELIYTEHVLFAWQHIYDSYAASRHVNFLNLIVNCGDYTQTNNNNNSHAKLGHSKASKHCIMTQILPATVCRSNCLFVKENFFANLTDRFRSSYKRLTHLWIELAPLDAVTQEMPQMASKVHIYLLNTPHEMPAELSSIILKHYFTRPRLLQRGHVYRIELNAQLLTSAIYAKYYIILVHLQQLFFRCLNLEISNTAGSSDLLPQQAVVHDSCSTLVQVPQTPQYLPSQLLHSIAFTTNYPAGLQQSYELLRSSFDTFLPRQNFSCLSSKEVPPVFLLYGERGSGKSKLINAVAADLGMHLFGFDCAEIVSQVPSHMEAKLKAIFAKNESSRPLIICFNNFEIFGLDAQGNEDARLLHAFELQLKQLFKEDRKFPVIFVALSNDKHMKPDILRKFLETMHLTAPNQQQRFELLCWLHMRELYQIFHQHHALRQSTVVPLIDMAQSQRYLHIISPQWLQTKQVLLQVADKTRGFLLGDLTQLYAQAAKQHKEEQFGAFTLADFEQHIEQMQKQFAASLGAPKVPKVLWSDIGGLVKLKDEIQTSIGMPLQYLHLLSNLNLRRSGILLYGPPGTGKTLVAKAVATECNLSFLSVQGPELLNMYVGQSERNVREIFERARAAAPCVIFLDELDSLAPNRGAAGDSGGVMDRVVSQLLAEMDNLGDATQPIFVLAATNRPDLIDPALLRPGRFDKMFYVAPSSSTAEKLAVLKAQTKRFYFDNDVDLAKIAASLESDMSGADIYAICSNAWYAALRRLVEKHQQAEIAEEQVIAENVIVCEHDFLKSFDKFIPSIRKEDLEYFKKLKNTYSMEESN